MTAQTRIGSKQGLVPAATDTTRTASGATVEDEGRVPVFAHPKDVHCVLFHALCLAAYALAFWLYLNPSVAGVTGPLSMIAFVATAAIMLGWISGIDVGVNFHNHVHRRIFRRAWMNRWFGRLWTFSGGWPAFFWEHCHTVHHAHVLSRRDWTLPKRRADGTWENYYAYCLLHWPWRYAVHFARDFRDGSTHRRKRAVRELAIFGALWSIPFWIDPTMALVLWVLPHWLANAAVMGPGMYAQHAGREEPDGHHTYRHSNCFVSRFFNATMFNIGHHALHHTYPWVHWSELPDLHDELRAELIADRAHVVPFGYYRAGMLLASMARGSQRARLVFEAQHPDYLPEKPAVARRACPRMAANNVGVQSPLRARAQPREGLRLEAGLRTEAEVEVGGKADVSAAANPAGVEPGRVGL